MFLAWSKFSVKQTTMMYVLGGRLGFSLTQRKYWSACTRAQLLISIIWSLENFKVDSYIQIGMLLNAASLASQRLDFFDFCSS